jgi:hypothetical protein
MLKEWLDKEITMEECEREHLVQDERLGPVPIPFGFQHQEWLKFKSKTLQGDELWKFCSPPDSWKNLFGRSGICIVRNGEIIDSIVTVMN